MAAREHEWQFDALDLHQVLSRLDDPDAWSGNGALRISRAGSASQVDVYLDTADRRFHRAGYSLRVRRVNRRVRAEATLKSLASAGGTGTMRNRQEISQDVGQADPKLLAGEDGPVSERVRAIAGRKLLAPLFEVRTRRQVYSVVATTGDSGETAAGEIAVDDTRIVPPGRAPATHLRRVELEAAEGAVSTLEPLAEKLRLACKLRPAELTKYEAGLLSAGLADSEDESFGPTDFDEDATIGAVATAVLRRQFSAFLEQEGGTRLGDDPECLHDMRVASRRLRAALSLFSDALLARVVSLRTDLRWIGALLGAVRDLDVQLEQLEGSRSTLGEADAQALSALRQLLKRQRLEARAALLEALDSRRYGSFVSRFARALRTSPARKSAAGTRPARDVAPRLIDDQMQALRKAADGLGPDCKPSAYHRLRIRGKHLRYTLEFFGDLYPRSAEKSARRLVALQDLLGRHQDADTAIVRLRALADEHGQALGPRTVFAMGELAERHRQSMEALRKKVPAALTRVRGKSWKALRKEAGRRRVEAVEPGNDPTVPE